MIRIQTEDFEVGSELAAMSAGNGRIGAVVTFTGLVRGGNGADDVQAIELEHYPAMTHRSLEQLEAEARARFDLIDVLIIHRIGHLPAGAQIVLVITSSAHRQAAFDGANFLMDRLKTTAPFWKSETRSGQKKWVDMKDSDIARADRWTTD